MEKLTAKLASSIPKLWTPTLDLAWLLNIYTPNTRKHPLLCYTVPRAMPSLPVFFRVCKEENQPSRLVCEVPSHTRFIKQVQTPFPFPKSVQMSNEYVHTSILVLGWTKSKRTKEYTHTHTTITNFWALPEPDQLLQLPKWNYLVVNQFKTTNQILGILLQEMTNR